MKNLMLIFWLLSSLHFAFGQSATNPSTCYVTLNTGSDDLRGGNAAYISFNLEDGTSSPEYLLSTGLGQNSVHEVEVKITNFARISLTDIRSITIRHDGAPRDAFQGYDNWDLLSLKIIFVDEANGTYPNVYNSINDRRRMDFVKRFTGDDRLLTVTRQR
jgi:hypothetical protein